MMSSITHHDDLRSGRGLQEASLFQHVRVHSRDVQACCHQVQRPASGQRCQCTGVRLHWGAQALCNICAINVTSTKVCCASAGRSDFPKRLGSAREECQKLVQVSPASKWHEDSARTCEYGQRTLPLQSGNDGVCRLLRSLS